MEAILRCVPIFNFLSPQEVSLLHRSFVRYAKEREDRAEEVETDQKIFYVSCKYSGIVMILRLITRGDVNKENFSHQLFRL